MSILLNAYLRIRPAILPGLCLALMVLVIDLAGGRSTDQTLSRVLCLMIVVVGTYVFVGNSGIVSFGQVAFMAIGAYVTAILTMRPNVKKNFLPDLPDALLQMQLDPWLATVIALFVVAAVALFVALPLMRLSGLAAGISTLALLAVVYETISNASGYTGGQQTLLGVPKAPENPVLLLVALVALVAAAWFQTSRYGLMLRASRDEPNAAASLGVRTKTYRIYAFVLSAAIVGVGGAFYAQALRTVSIASFYIDMTAMTLAMLVVGGMRSLAGAVAGVVVISLALDLVRRLEQGNLVSGVTLPAGSTEVLVGMAMLAMLLLYPAGLTRGREFLPGSLWPKGRARDIETHREAAKNDAV
ncbi:MAG: branched-chain amino acid ABC transporter permease [Rhodobacteraceae bacterium]|jgi:branched-chain amino acid transport system permease protein|nr:branched-chain amino acid ABC transporter permease [Paracoccaceae bacterium]